GTDGIALSTNGGNTFTVIADGASATATKAQLIPASISTVTALALSSDFDGSQGAGELSVGWATPGGSQISTTTLSGPGLFNSSGAPTTTGAISGAITGSSSVNVLSLAYAPGSSGSLAALVAVLGGANAGTYGVQRTSATVWPAVAAGSASAMSTTPAVA